MTKAVKVTYTQEVIACLLVLFFRLFLCVLFRFEENSLLTLRKRDEIFFRQFEHRKPPNTCQALLEKLWEIDESFFAQLKSFLLVNENFQHIQISSMKYNATLDFLEKNIAPNKPEILSTKKIR